MSVTKRSLLPHSIDAEIFISTDFYVPEYEDCTFPRTFYNDELMQSENSVFQGNIPSRFFLNVLKDTGYKSGI